MLNIENHLDLIRKITWSYVKGNPGLEFDDLFSEACLACLEARDKFNPERGKESTFIWAVVKNALINLCTSPAGIVDKRYTSCINKMCTSPEEQLVVKEEWRSILSSLSPKSRQVCSLVLNRTSPYLPTDKPKTCRGIIIKELRKRGWAWPEIWKSFREIKQVLSLQS